MARSKFRSQHVKNTRGSDHSWTFRCRFAWQAQGIVHLVQSEQSVKVLWHFQLQTPLHHPTLQYTTLQLQPHLHYIPLPTLHSTPLHYTTAPNYIQLHCATLHYTPPHSTTLHYINYTQLLSITLHNTTLHSTTRHYIPLRYTPLHYTTTTLHYIPLHYTTLDYTPLYIQLHYTTLHYTLLRYTTFHYTTLATATSSTAQGGGGSFKNRKLIGEEEVGCCESRILFLSLSVSFCLFL